MRLSSNRISSPLPLILPLLAACSSSPSPSVDARQASPEAAKAAEATTHAEATTTDINCVPLTVKNYLSWCDVTVGSGAASTGPVQTVCVTPGTSVPLSATANPGFILGDWHGTAGDTGSGDPGTVTGTGSSAKSSTTVVASSPSSCVWVCCPFTSGAGCPTTNQCP